MELYRALLVCALARHLIVLDKAIPGDIVFLVPQKGLLHGLYLSFGKEGAERG